MTYDEYIQYTQEISGIVIGIEDKMVWKNKKSYS